MPADELVWHSANIPADFPTHDVIVSPYDEAGFDRNGFCILVAGIPRYWVKYGRDSLVRGEVKAAQNANPTSVVRVPEVHLGFSRGKKRGYIVMDFAQGTTLAQRKSPKGNYHKDDINAVAAAAIIKSVAMEENVHSIHMPMLCYRPRAF